ncbi:Glutamate-rich protein 6 [Liparis tanakae]|uniref:Glutamate-rich protein 6 n=1 Tax=Liparis tanakae TaxID=230148 RepID=A0A4Z2F869_9TELE|nr:Glutamate-rich protein 6 [Liparis tanakae]
MVEGDGVSAVVGFVGQQLKEKLQQVYDTRARLEFPANALGELPPGELRCHRSRDRQRTPEGGPQPVSDPPTHCLRAAGVLRYNRESDHHGTNSTTMLQALEEYPVICEYCGEEAQPSLDLTWAWGPETPLFCCARWERLCTMLVTQRRQMQEAGALRTRVPTSPRDTADQLFLKDQEMEDHNKCAMDLERRLRRFRLHREEEEKVALPCCDHQTLSFGICHHQQEAELLQKSYSNGAAFLTVFPDGSAQVFYPSGLLALLVVVTETNGRVCLVYDDSDASTQPMRALFLSNGRATCYHSNRNTWLSLDSSGGQCLDEEGSRLRRWSWSSLTPLQPVFLSLNKSVGVRVLGREQVFVSFLARGQQAKFSVGDCCVQNECKTVRAAPGPLKEDLFVKAAGIRIQLLLQNIHQILLTPSCARLPKTKMAAQRGAEARQLLEVTAGVMMEESERDFIHRASMCVILGGRSSLQVILEVIGHSCSMVLTAGSTVMENRAAWLQRRRVQTRNQTSESGKRRQDDSPFQRHDFLFQQDHFLFQQDDFLFHVGQVGQVGQVKLSSLTHRVV